MLEVADQFDPLVLAFFPHRECRRRKIRIVEGSERNGNEIRKIAPVIMEGRAALRTEAVSDLVAGIRFSQPRFGLARDGHLAAVEPSLGAEGASRTLLASETMANRNPNRF